MRFRTTAILLLVFLALAAYVLWIEVPKAEHEAEKKSLVQLNADDVTEISLAYADREIVVSKSGAEWRLVKPIEAPADGAAAKNLATSIAQAEITKEITEPSSNPAEYGFDQPLVTVTVRMGEKTLPAIQIGKATPVGFNAYVKKADDAKVYLTSASFRTGMDKQAKDLRDKTIASFSDADVRKIRVQGEGGDILLSQKDNQWSIEQPATYAADGAAIRNFLSTLRSMRAVDFPAEMASDQYGLDEPTLAVTLTLGDDGRELRLAFGKETEQKQIFVQRNRQGTVYAVNDWVRHDLNKTVDDFRDKTVLAVDRDAVAGIQIAGKQGTVKLVRGADKTWRVEGVEEKALQPPIDQYLADLVDLKGYEIVADHPDNLAPFGLEPATLTVTLFGKDEQEIGRVLFGERPGGEGKVDHTAMQAGGPTVYLVRDYLVTRLNKTKDAFVEKAPGATPAAGVALDGAAGEEEEMPDADFDADADTGE
jgi:hypothetical protein